jgi:anti-sigma factor RsiW
MTCPDLNPLLNAYFDGELDLAGSLEIERHLSGCSACSSLYRRMEVLRQEIVDADLDFGANKDLSRLRASIRRHVSRSEPWLELWRRPWIAGAAAAALLFAVIVPFRPAATGNQTEREVVDGHIRSMMPDHLMDVPSSDHHTVKPWFEGKLNFSPPVPDLAAQGFTLTGGRVDVIAGKPAAAIVYMRRKHVINLWIVRAESSSAPIEQHQLDGFNIMQWKSGPLAYWAVSDLNAAELRQFADLVRRDSPSR